MPVPLLIVLGILLLLLLLLLMPIRVCLSLRESLICKLRIFCFSVRLYPRTKKNIRCPSRKNADRGKSKKKKKHTGTGHLKTAKSKDFHPTLRDNLRLLRVLTGALIRRTKKYLCLRTVRLHLRVATGDAATTAVLYGAVSASLACLLELLQKVIRVRSRPDEISVCADYLSEKPSADIKLVFSIRVFGLVSIAISLAVAYLKTRRSQRHRQNKPSQPPPESSGAIIV